MAFGSSPVWNVACQVFFPGQAGESAELRDLLIVTPDNLGATRIGLGMRHWEMARALGLLGFSVTLTSCAKQEKGLVGEHFTLAEFSQESLPNLIARHRAVLTQGVGVFHMPEQAFSGQCFIVDMVTPMHMENVGNSEGRYDEGYECAREGLRRGDFLVCGNERQRLYWLGLLAALKRTGCAEYTRHAEYRALIDVVPFGIRETPPVLREPGIRNAETGFAEGDFVLLWFGGIWDWLDPLPFIRAVHKAHAQNPRVKVFFSMFAQKGKQPTKSALSARDEAQRLGLLGNCVYFRPEPVPFAER